MFITLNPDYWFLKHKTSCHQLLSFWGISHHHQWFSKVFFFKIRTLPSNEILYRNLTQKDKLRLFIVTYWFLHSLHIPSSPPRISGGSPIGVWAGAVFEKTLGHWSEGSELLSTTYRTLYTWLLYFTDLWPHHPPVTRYALKSSCRLFAAHIMHHAACSPRLV